MHTILTVTQVFLSIGLIGLVLIQHGRGADAGAAFGSGASATVFGARGSGSFLSRATGIIAALFFLTSMAMAYYAGQGSKQKGLRDGVIGLPVRVETPATVKVQPPVAVPEANEPLGVPMVPGVAAKATSSDVPVVPGAAVDAAPISVKLSGDGPPKDVPVVLAPVKDQDPAKVEVKDEAKDRPASQVPAPEVAEPAATAVR